MDSINILQSSNNALAATREAFKEGKTKGGIKCWESAEGCQCDLDRFLELSREAIRLTEWFFADVREHENQRIRENEDWAGAICQWVTDSVEGGGTCHERCGDLERAESELVDFIGFLRSEGISS